MMALLVRLRTLHVAVSPRDGVFVITFLFITKYLTFAYSHGYGPGKDEFESTQIIGENQFLMALQLYKTASSMYSSHFFIIF